MQVDSDLTEAALSMLNKCTLQSSLAYLVCFRVASISCLAVLGGCAAVQEAPVPGLGSESARPEVYEEISESDVLAALKCQMTRGFLRVNKLKSASSYSENANAAKFVFKSGSGTLAGKMSSLVTNGAAINVVFPFSGFDGTNAKPNIGRTSASTAASEVKTTFNIEPTVGPQDFELCLTLEKEGVEVGDFVTNAIVGAFTSAMDVPKSPSGKPYGPPLTTSVIEVSTSFTILRMDAGGFALKVVPSAPRVDEGNAVLTRIQDRTDVYTVTTKLPTLVGEKSDSRRLHFCRAGVTGKRVCVEEPFTVERYEELTTWLGTTDAIVPPARFDPKSFDPLWLPDPGQDAQPAVDFLPLFPDQPEGADF